MLTHNGQIDTGLTTAQQDEAHAYRRLVKAMGADEARKKRKMWDDELPHMGGTAPHRMDIGGGSCVYCFRPASYKPEGQ